VAFLGLNSDQYCEYYFAVPWADATVNPINIRWAAKEIAYALADSQTRALMVDDSFLPMMDEVRNEYDGLDTVIYAGYGTSPPGMVRYEDLAAHANPIDDVRRGGDALAGLFYTGGTTGAPKAVMLSHANLVTSALGIQASKAFPDIGRPVLHAAPMFHLAALSEVVISAQTGRTQVILPSFEPLSVLKAVDRHRIAGLRLVPVMLQMLLDHPYFSEFDLSCVRSVGYGASPITESLLRRAMALLPQAKFTQAFGQTELSPVTTLLGPQDHALQGQRAGLLRSAGRAAPHAEIRVVDSDDRPLPAGQVGQIVVRGGHVMLGYWNRPAETAVALRGGWMHTGDAGCIDENGYLYVVDRLKDMIITGGENVYSTEVENAITSHPAVRVCAVIGIPDDFWGESVHAVVETAAGASLTIEELRSHTKQFLAAYKCPRSFEVVDQLPVSASGKVVKAELRARLERR
jgi:acyl-CoA synthetase (AMP-forming)/AMP-acid ligase II